MIDVAEINCGTVVPTVIGCGTAVPTVIGCGTAVPTVNHGGDRRATMVAELTASRAEAYTCRLATTSDTHQDESAMSFGENSGTGFETLRGRNFPAIRQFTIFLENRVGQLLEVVKRFEGTGIRICALSINDAAECAFVRFLVSDADRGREILERSGLAIIETDLVGVELPDGPQPLLRVCTALLQAELNIIQAYPLIVRPHGSPAVAIMVDNIELAMETLTEKGFTIITEGDLEDDPATDM